MFYPISLLCLLYARGILAWSETCTNVEDCKGIPSSGFYTSGSRDGQKLFQISKKLTGVLSCARISIQRENRVETNNNVNYGEVMYEFDLDIDSQLNGRPVWYSAQHKNFLFFMPHKSTHDPYGTWLIGDKLGVDSGYGLGCGLDLLA